MITPDLLAGLEVLDVDGRADRDAHLAPRARDLDRALLGRGEEQAERVGRLRQPVDLGVVADAARAAGITSPLDDPDEGIALGNKEVSTLELASAYATIAGS